MTQAATSLASMLRLCPTWVEITAGNVYDPDAENGIFLRNCGPDVARPVAVIQPFEALSFRVIAGGSQNSLRAEGGLVLYMAIDIPEEFRANTIAAEFRALDTFSLVMQQLAEQAGYDDRLSLVEITLLMHGPTPEEDIPDLGLYYWSSWLCRWGDQ